VKDVAPKDLRKTFSWCKWHFSSCTVECCSCRAANPHGAQPAGTWHGAYQSAQAGEGGSGGILSQANPESRQIQAHPALKESQNLHITQKNGCTLMHFATLGP